MFLEMFPGSENVLWETVVVVLHSADSEPDLCVGMNMDSRAFFLPSYPGLDDMTSEQSWKSEDQHEK